MLLGLSVPCLLWLKLPCFAFPPPYVRIKMLIAKSLGIFTVRTALQTALQLRNSKSTLKLPGLKAVSSMSSVTHSSLQAHFHWVVPKLCCGGCGQLCAHPRAPHAAACSVDILFVKVSLLLIV